MHTRRSYPDLWFVLIALTATIGLTTATVAFKSALLPPKPRPPAMGHPPAFTALPQAGHPVATASADPAAPQGSAAAALIEEIADAQARGSEFELPASVLAPLAAGEFVNFESPVVRPVAVSEDGSRVFLANTPNNSLVVLQTAGGLSVEKEIFAGLDPVSVGIQPRTQDNVVWVANHVSDTVSVIDIAAGRIVAVIDVGDEPVNIVFNSSGRFAFIVIQGSPFVPDTAAPSTSPFVDLGHVVTVDADTHQVVSNTYLDCNTPRAAVYDEANDLLIVAAHHSGNRTTLAGQPVELEFLTPAPTNPPPSVGIPAEARGCPPSNACGDSDECVCRTMPNLWVAQQFSATAAVFNPNSNGLSELSPWPDDLGSNGAPLVPRIVPDDSGDWNTIVHGILADSDGLPDPAMVALMNEEFGIRNADAVIAHMMDDAKPTADHDLIVLDVSDPAGSAGAGLPVLNVVGDVGTTLNDMAVNPVTGKILVSNMEALNLTRLTKNLKGHFIDHKIEFVSGLDQSSPMIQGVDLHAGIPGFHDVSGPNPLARQNSLANPQNVVVHAGGAWAYVASLGMDRVGVLNADTGRVVGRVDVPEGPRGLAIDSTKNRLYVWSRHAAVLSVVDVANATAPVVLESLELFNPEPAFIREGRQFHYSAGFANNGAHSCDSCHPSTGFDRLAWDLGSNGPANQPGPPNMPGSINHPLKGPMVTLSLRGLARHEPLHWRGDKPLFQDFNDTFERLLGGEQIPSEDMDAFDAFIGSVVYPPNPYFKRTNAYKVPRAVAGLTPYLTFCNACHQLAPDQGNPLGHDGAAFTTNGDAGISAAAFFGQLQLVTQLRDVHKKFIGDVYNGFGMIHDGREEREDNDHPLQTFLDEFFPEELTGITPPQQLDMIATLNAFPSNVMNVVGWQIPVPPPPAPAAVLADLDTMLAQHNKTPSHCDVVIKGLYGGEQRGFHVDGESQDGAPLVRSDLNELFALDELLAGMAESDALVVTAVPPGSGKRIGIDQDTDALPDGADPMPQHDNTGDFDIDGDVDLADYAAFQRCFTTNSDVGAAPAECLLADSDEDGDVDLADHAAVHALLSGPG